jgi:hypothetical protein
MTLNTIVKARENGAVDVLSKMRLSSGKQRYKLRATLKDLRSELEIADAERERLVLEVAPATREIPPGHPEYARVMSELVSFYEAESRVKVEAVFAESELDGIPMNVEQEDSIYELGLVVVNVREERLPREFAAASVVDTSRPGRDEA